MTQPFNATGLIHGHITGFPTSGVEPVVDTSSAPAVATDRADETFIYDELPGNGDGVVLGFRCAARDLVSALEHVHGLCRSNSGSYGLAVDGTHGYLFGADGEFWAVARFGVTSAVPGRATMREASAQALLEVADDDREVALEVRGGGPSALTLRYATSTGSRASRTVPVAVDFPFDPLRPFGLEGGSALRTLATALRAKQPMVGGAPLPQLVARALRAMARHHAVRVYKGDGYNFFSAPNKSLGWGVVPAFDSQTDPPIEAAERWRSTLIGLLQSEESPKALHHDLMMGIETRAWTHLTNELGNKFRDFEDFCAAEPPFGPGVSAVRVREILEKLVGPRQTDLLLVPPARQGLRGAASRQGGGKSVRANERLRAVERAPQPIQKLYALDGIALADAARINAASDDEVAIAVARATQMLTELGDEPTAAALREARKSFKMVKAPPESRAQRLLRQVDQLSPEDRAEFDRLYRARREDHTGPGLAKASKPQDVERAHAALVRLGWKSAQARVALETLRGSSAETVQDLVRDASAILTKAAPAR